MRPAPQRLEQPLTEPRQPNLFQQEETVAPVYAEQPRYTPQPQQEYRQPYAQDEQGFDIDEVLAQPQVQPQSGAGQFTAPRRPSPGTPSPETLARLQRAVQKAPEQPLVRQRVAAPLQQEPEAERPSRFGIGSLISRMAGHAPEAPSAAQRRVSPPLQQYDEEHAPAASDDRIEIPAFLRRQAN